MWAKTVTQDQQNQVGSVQQEQDRTENGPLRYTAHDQSKKILRDLSTHWDRPTRYVWNHCSTILDRP